MTRQPTAHPAPAAMEAPPAAVQRPSGRDVALIDLVDRLLAGGVVLGGEIVLAAADIDLTRIGLSLKAGVEQFREQVQNIE